MKSGYLQVLAMGLAFGAGATAVSIESSTPDMNDRIIADTAKCVAAGMEPEAENQRGLLAGDKWIIVCKPPGGKESNLDRMLRQMNMPEHGPVKKQTPPNPDSFETKSKVTQ